MTEKNKKDSFLRQTYSAGISGVFKGNVSSFNQFIIIISIALIVLIIIFTTATIKSNFNFLSAIYILLAMLGLFWVAGFIRHCCIKPADDSYPTTTKIAAINKVIEIQNAPSALITQEFISAMASLRFFENDAPVGLIEGTAGDPTSIKLLTEQERQSFKEDEKKKIIEHQKDVVVKVQALNLSAQVINPKVD